MRTFEEVKQLDWSKYKIEDMYEFRFEVDNIDSEELEILGKKIKTKATYFEVNSLYAFSKVEPKKEFIILSDYANSERGYYWTKDIVENGFDENGEPIYDYLLMIFNSKVQNFMKEKNNIFMPCF
jgi:hypothetical protein